MHRHIEEWVGGAFGAGGGLVMIEITGPQGEFLISAGSALLFGFLGAAGGMLAKRLFKKKHDDK